MQLRSILASVLFSGVVHGHMSPFAHGMYCFNGTDPTVVNQNMNDSIEPLFNLTRDDWWMHHVNKCDEFPPVDDDFLEIPARGAFTVEIAENRAFTSFSYGGALTSAWGDGRDHPDDYSIINLGAEPKPSDSGCIPSPNMHTQNETMAAGTVFAISYQSDITKVTEENLVVFTAKYRTPWKLLTTYQVPDLPACPPGGCHCVWGWVPNHCGTPNIYMFPYKCMVTGATSTIPLAPAKPPVWCEDDQTRCVSGAKQMIFWNQYDGNNVVIEGRQLDEDNKSPGYNQKMGFNDGAQNDIFATNPATSTLPISTVEVSITPLAVSTPTPEAPITPPSMVGSASTVTVIETQTVSYCPTSAVQTPTISASTVTVTMTQSVSHCPIANKSRNHHLRHNRHI